DSVLAIELDDRHRPNNPLVSAGAIASVSMVPAQGAQNRWDRIAATISAFAGRLLPVDEQVYRSVAATNWHNQGIAWLLKGYDVVKGNPIEALDLYTRQCSLSVTARDLAVMGATLASGGTNPLTHQRIVSPETAAKVLAVMMTAGLYENSG